MDFKDRLREEIEFKGLLGKEIAAQDVTVTVHSFLISIKEEFFQMWRLQ